MINSTFRKVWNHSPLKFPEFTGTRIMMMPVKLGSYRGVPLQYAELLSHTYGAVEVRFIGEIGYLTIDEKVVEKGQTLRREGLHVDGYYHGRCGAWGGGGGWGSVGNGMFTISSTPHCEAYLGKFEGEPKDEGECEHIDLNNAVPEIFEANELYWVDGACIHKSLPVEEDTKRQFLRLSMPSNAPWFKGYTKNPKGILPSNDILPRRDKFMKTKG